MTDHQKIDLNADVGEFPALVADGTQEAVMRLVSSVNVACGGHAGDEATIRTTLELAKTLGLAVGAHPGYPDREGFGRRKMEIHAIELSRSIRDQLRFLWSLAEQVGVQITHVKPHGALYNLAADDEILAEAIGAGVSRFNRDLTIVGLAGSPGLEVYRRLGFRVVGEAFIDRRYDANARLIPRGEPDALISDPSEALDQALGIVLREEVPVSAVDSAPIHAQTLCIHAETPGAQVLAGAVRRGLEANGIQIARLL
jgi:UPF0271 protein